MFLFRRLVDAALLWSENKVALHLTLATICTKFHSEAFRFSAARIFLTRALFPFKQQPTKRTSCVCLGALAEVGRVCIHSSRATQPGKGGDVGRQEHCSCLGLIFLDRESSPSVLVLARRKFDTYTLDGDSACDVQGCVAG